MASSDVEVCNIALQMLGAKPITAFTEVSDRASICSQFYATARDETLRSHPWNFAQVRKVLAREVTAPAWGYTYQYQLPADPYCLKVNEIDPDDGIYFIEGRKIVTDESALNIRYTARVTDPTQYDAQFTMALAQHLAEMMAWPLTKLGALSKDMYAKWREIRSEARTSDSQESSTSILENSVLVDVRSHGFRTFNRSKNPFA